MTNYAGHINWNTTKKLPQIWILKKFAVTLHT